METSLIVALIAGGVALVSAAGNVWTSIRTAERSSANARLLDELKSERERAHDAAQRQREISKYSEPLARAAYDLQSRLYNILRLNFVDTYLGRGNPREQAYVVDNSCYVVAQFLCWTELIRRDVQFIDLDGSNRTLALTRCQDRLCHLLGSDRYGAAFRIFAGEQRAIGEALIWAPLGESECMGYGGFLQTFPPGANPLIDAVRGDVRALAADLASASERLVMLQHALVELLDLLDPQGIRFPADHRTKA